MQAGKKQYVMQALRYGVLAELEAATRYGCPDVQNLAVAILSALLGYPEAMEQMREAGLWPSLLVDLTDTPDEHLLLVVVRTILDLQNTRPQLAGEVLAAGLLQRLEGRCSQSFGTNAEGTLRTAICELGLLHSLNHEQHELNGMKRSARPVRAARRGVRIPGGDFEIFGFLFNVSVGAKIWSRRTPYLVLMFPLLDTAH